MMLGIVVLKYGESEQSIWGIQQWTNHMLHWNPTWVCHVYKRCSPEVFMDTCVPLFPDRAIPGICIRATIPECARWNCGVFAKEWSGTSEARENTSRGVCTEWLRVTWVRPSLCCTKDWDFPTWYAWYYLEKTTTMTAALLFFGSVDMFHT